MENPKNVFPKVFKLLSTASRQDRLHRQPHQNRGKRRGDDILCIANKAMRAHKSSKICSSIVLKNT